MFVFSQTEINCEDYAYLHAKYFICYQKNESDVYLIENKEFKKMNLSAKNLLSIKEVIFSTSS